MAVASEKLVEFLPATCPAVSCGADARC